MHPKPWLESWVLSHLNPLTIVRGYDGTEETREEEVAWVASDPKNYPESEHECAVARLLSLAPAMARTLCLVEWSGSQDIYDYGSADPVCPVCQGSRTTIEHRRAPGDNIALVTVGGHEPDCLLDAVLTAAGLTEEDRDYVRRTSGRP